MSSRTASAASAWRSRSRIRAPTPSAAVRALARCPTSRRRPRTAWSARPCASARARSSRRSSRLSEAGVGVDDLALRRPTLDDVFLALTGHAAEEPSDPRTAGSGRPHEPPRHRHADHRRAQPDPAAPRAGTADRLHRAADHVRAAVPLCVRRRDPHARLQLRRLPAPRDHRAEHRLRRLRHGARSQRGYAQGTDRPLSLAADVAGCGARRAHALRRRHQLALAGDPADHRRDHRLQLSDAAFPRLLPASACCCCSAMRSPGFSPSSACSSPRRNRSTRSASSPSSR